MQRERERVRVQVCSAVPRGASNYPSAAPPLSLSLSIRRSHTLDLPLPLPLPLAARLRHRLPLRSGFRNQKHARAPRIIDTRTQHVRVLRGSQRAPQ